MRSEQLLSSLLAEMTQAKELVMQLRAHSYQISPYELQRHAVPKMLACIDRSIHYAKLHSSIVQIDSACVGNVRPKDNTDPASKYQQKEILLKKRKAMPKWKSQARQSSDGRKEGPYDDGFCWRKYGQKEILGAKHPRSYFRCSYRHIQGCLATKQVQLSDEDPKLFDITYHGNHTCIQRDKVIPRSVAGMELVQEQNQAISKDNLPYEQLQKKDHLLVGSQTGVTVGTNDLDSLNSFTGSAPVVGINNDIFSSEVACELQSYEFDISEICSACYSPVMSIDFLPTIHPDLLLDPSCNLE